MTRRREKQRQFVGLTLGEVNNVLSGSGFSMLIVVRHPTIIHAAIGTCKPEQGKKTKPTISSQAALWRRV